MLKSIRRAQEGSVSVFLVLVAVVLIGFMGLAIDMARGYAVKQHLQKAVDAATLAATKVLEETNPDPDYPRTVGENYFWNNWRDGYLGSGPVTLNVTYDRDAGKATVNAKVDLEPVIMGFLGVNDFHFDTSAEAQRKKISLELAIALDNTASMALGAEAGLYDKVPSDVDKRRITLVKNAAKLLLDILYEGEQEVPNMYVSVVPFTSMVNVGKSNTGFLRGGAGALSGLTWSPPDNINGLTSTQKAIYNGQREWRGCVFERGAGKRTGFNVSADYSGNDLTDAPPSVEAFYPYNVPPPTFYAGVNCRRSQAYSPPGTCYNWICPPEGACYKGDPVGGYACGGNPARSKYNNNGFTDREISTYGVKTTYVNADQTSPNFGKYCVSTDPTCVPNRGPARRCFPWETPEWDKKAPADTHYTLNPSSFWNGFPYLIPQAGDGGAYNYDRAGTKDKDGNVVNPGFPTFTSSGFTTVVLNDDISACGNAANVAGGDTNGYYYCSNTSLTSSTDTFGRWIPSWPITATTTAEAKLGGWGNSGCGLPILPLVTKYDDVLGRINSMDVPVNDGNNPARGYYGTIINQGLVWAWRTISPSWRNLWTGAALTTLPFDYTSSTDVHNKAIVILTDGLNYMQRNTEIGTGRVPYTAMVGWNDGGFSGVIQPDHRDYDSTAYGRLLDRWFYKGGNASLIAYNTTASDEATKGQPAYQELNRRLLATCDNIRAKGIKIFLIAFAVEASPVKADANATFNSCVGTTGKYYDAVDEASLTDAFKDIAAQLVELRLLK